MTALSALLLTFAVAVVGVGVGCGARQSSPDGQRLFTLFDVAGIADADEGGAVAVGSRGFPKGIPVETFLSPVRDATGASTGEHQLTVSTGFVDGQVMYYATTELWMNFDRVWAQPLYRALTADDNIDDPTVAEPWVFGVGPTSLFYSPFWEVFAFHVPSGVDVTTLLDTRAVLMAANTTGGVRRLDRRITTLAPRGVIPDPNWMENNYFDDTAAWDGVGAQRYLDFGTGRFDVDAAGEVPEFPLFVFVQRDADGDLQSIRGWPTVGGTRAVFSSPPNLSPAADDAGVVGDPGVVTPPPPLLPPDSLEPNFGGLWRLYTVEVPAKADLTADKRVIVNPRCVEQHARCVLLDSQAAIETLGPEKLRRTEFLATCPLLALGSTFFPRIPLLPPRRPLPP